MKKNSLKELFVEIKVLLRSVPSLVIAANIVAIILMNFLANKLVPLNTEYIVIDCGIFISWVVFLTMDITTRHFGHRAANIISVISLLGNLFASFLFFFCSILPGIWSESYVEGSEDIINMALDNTIGGTWYILMGSSIAFLVSALVNNFLNDCIGAKIGEYIKKKNKKRSFGTFALRSYVSTFIGQFVDNLVFALIVSHHFFGLSLLQCIICAFTGAIVEMICEVIFSPIGYKITLNWEKDNVGKDYLNKYRNKAA